MGFGLRQCLFHPFLDRPMDRSSDGLCLGIVQVCGSVAAVRGAVRIRRGQGPHQIHATASHRLSP
eukprot:3181172-Rhodomonas_salina.1